MRKSVAPAGEPQQICERVDLLCPETPGDEPPASAVRRVLIVDEHPIVRRGLRSILEDQGDLVVCGEAETLEDLRAALGDRRPDVLICDIGSKGGGGIDLVRCARAHHPQLRILVLSALDETLYAERMLSIGANGYIAKESSTEEFLASIRCVLDGHIYVSETIRRNMLRRYAGRVRPTSDDPVDRLSNRELQILLMIGKGIGTRETAQSLHLSVKTVESHRQSIKRKLNLGTATQLMRYAVLTLERSEPESGRMMRKPL
jgi:DNA-binding NarL/FixJ family response regulator